MAYVGLVRIVTVCSRASRYNRQAMCKAILHCAQLWYDIARVSVCRCSGVSMSLVFRSSLVYMLTATACIPTLCHSLSKHLPNGWPRPVQLKQCYRSLQATRFTCHCCCVLQLSEPFRHFHYQLQVLPPHMGHQSRNDWC